MMFGSAAWGQRIYWGVIGGTGLTPDFPVYSASAPADVYGNPAYAFQHLPGPRSLILGGLLELQLTDSLAIEADVLHRPLRAIVSDTIFPAGSPSVTNTLNEVAANTWEFPVMLKWSLPSPLETRRIRPFVEGGIAFRTSQNDLAALPSQFGLTAGVGVAIPLGKLRVSPTIRYTRWDKETFFPPYPTKGDQLEFLTSVAWGTSSEQMHAAGHRLYLGVVGGLSVNGEFYYPGSGVRERVGYLAGASTQLDFHHGLSLEIDGIYKPLLGSFDQFNGFTVITWDFPVLIKYHVAQLGQGLFVEAGPSFRVAGNLNGYNPSHYGVTAGVGWEKHTGRALLSTALRYTRWAKDELSFSPPAGVNYDYPRTNANVVELIMGAGF